MRENAKAREQFELTLDGRQVGAVVVGSLVLLGAVFVLGLSAGRHAAARAAGPLDGGADALAKLDEGLPVRAKEEPAPALQAHDALVAASAKPIPVPEVKGAPAPAAPKPAAPAPVRVGAKAGATLISMTASDGASGDAPPAPAPPAVDASAAAPEPAAAPAAPAALASAPPPAVELAEPRPAPRSQPASAPRAAPAPRAHAAAHAAAPRADRKARVSYAVQVGAAPTRAEADRIARRYAGKGARVVTADVPGKGRWYRVQLGRYDSKDAATRQVASLSRSGVKAIVIAAR